MTSLYLIRNYMRKIERHVNLNTLEASIPGQGRTQALALPKSLYDRRLLSRLSSRGLSQHGNVLGPHLNAITKDSGLKIHLNPTRPFSSSSIALNRGGGSSGGGGDGSRTSDNGASGATPEPPNPQGRGKIMILFQKYGWFFVGYVTGMWIFTGFVIYSIITAFGKEKALEMLKNLGVDKYIDLDSIQPQYVNLAIAIAINEALETIRFPLCVATTPAAMKIWRRVVKK